MITSRLRVTENTQLKEKLEMIVFLILFLNLKMVCCNEVFLSPCRKLHTPTNILLLSLAVSDFLVGLLLMPGEIMRHTACWFFGDLMCSLYNYVSYIVTSASVDMVLISVDRYVAICDPLRYPARVTDRRVKAVVCLCWLCSVIYGCLVVLDDLVKPSRHKSCVGDCLISVDFIAGTVDLIVSFVVPVAVIIVLYVRVFVAAVSQARVMRAHVTAVTLQLSVNMTKKSELKAARTLGVLVVGVFSLNFLYRSEHFKTQFL
uniref:G-protein coupled receptors family 1 profile domain-containing protein n=1 Tax=Xiphophorus maculatus TaxID=8083 RepID=A0A3B5PZE8_XIPMA